MGAGEQGGGGQYLSMCPLGKFFDSKLSDSNWLIKFICPGLKSLYESTHPIFSLHFVTLQCIALFGGRINWDKLHSSHRFTILMPFDDAST